MQGTPRLHRSGDGHENQEDGPGRHRQGRREGFMSTTEIVKASPREVKALMESQADRLASLLPRHLSPEKVVNVVSTLVYRTPKLQECAPASILAAVMQACELGLELSPALG